MATQTTAPIEVTTVLGDDSFQLRSLHWEERLGYPFEGKLVLVSDTANIDLQSLLKTPASVRVDGPGGTPSYFNGYIAKAENLGPEIRQTRYSVTLVPAIALLRHSGGCRIFQEFTVIDIVKKIFSNFGFSGELEMRLSGEYEKRDYCVQYCESDFNFLHRILQSEGIYYFFEYSEEKHCMVLADDVQAHASASGNETILYRPTKDTRLDEFLTELKTSRKFVTGAVELGDYDFEKPRAKLTA
ncbi:MAG: type VI secretion system tip protein TssI/VgrG, partial [Planctomycetota bacterium]